MSKFDWQYYLERYPDLNANGIKTEQQALQHWFDHGEKEGRVSIRTPLLFDWQYYLERYPDLSANGIKTEQQALQHWFDHGEKEGRVSIRTPLLFDWQYYLEKYPHLVKPTIIDWQYYLDKYPDLRENGVNTEEEAIQHWLNYGEKEARVAYGTQCGFAISTYHRNSNRIESFKICISSIMKFKKEDTIVIIVDDGSIVKDHISWVKMSFPNIIVIEKEINGGIAKCKNTCLRALYESNCDVFFLLDDDIEILQPIEDIYVFSLQHKLISILSARLEYNPIISPYFNNTIVTQELNGYLMCFTKNTFIETGYFKVFPCKYGYEHVWYTRKAMKTKLQDYYLDIINSHLYITILNIESSVCEEQKICNIAENSLVLINSNYNYEICIE
jgi:hypothetical protein